MDIPADVCVGAGSEGRKAYNRRGVQGGQRGPRTASGQSIFTLFVEGDSIFVPCVGSRVLGIEYFGSGSRLGGVIGVNQSAYS